MKNILFTLLIATSSFVSIAQKTNNFSAATLQKNAGITAVNNLDTIVFDIEQATITGTQIDVPVYFLSDDTINALDFSFLYNQTNFVYDTIIDLTNYLSELSFYNPNDQRVRFTSYSLQTITNDTPLVIIRLNILSGQFCASDFDSVKVYLNGDVCSKKVITCSSTGISETGNNNSFFSVYPNPASEVLTLETTQAVSVQMLSTDGKQLSAATINANEKYTLQTKSIPNGIYYLKLTGNDFTTVKKVVVNH